MNNLEIYNSMKEVPEKAKKKIGAGRLKGMTDIKPVWRIEKLTELFGPCGIGWKVLITNKEIIEGANEEKIAIVDIELYVKIAGEWSEAIVGTGGSSFISKESKGLYTSDECFKMAFTDAISVATKSLGMGADVYWGDSKYNTNSNTNTPNSTPTQNPSSTITEAQAKRIFAIAKGNQTLILQTIMKYGYKTGKEVLVKDYEKIVNEIEKEVGGNK